MEMKDLKDQLDRLSDRLMSMNREVGALQSETSGINRRLDGLETDIKERLNGIEEQQKSISLKLDGLLHAEQRVKGGWKVATFFGTLILIFAGFFGWLVDKWNAIF